MKHGRQSAQSPRHNNETFVIGAGFGRTGTSSLQIALSKLGWRAYHATELFKNKSTHSPLWLKAGNKKNALKELKNIKSFNNFNEITMSKHDFDWDQIFDSQNTKNGYNSCLDFPAAAFYLDIAECYKATHKTKIILTVRDNAEKWYESVKKTFVKMDEAFDSWFGQIIHRILFGDVTTKKVCVGALLFDEKVSFFKNKANCIDKYKKWNESVIKLVDSDQLLVFNVKEGWKPLCDFLEIEGIPNEPFPHANDSKVLGRIANVIKMTSKIANCIVVGCCSVAVYYAYQYFMYNVMTTTD